MKLLTSLVMVVIICLAGCKDSEETLIPQNVYRMEVEDLVDSKGKLLVKRLLITAHGERTIGITCPDSSAESVTLNPDPRTGNDLVTGDVIILADLIEISKSEKKRLRWLTQVKNQRGSWAGGPDLYQVPATSNLKDIVKLNIQSGEHPIGQPLVLGHFQDKEILLTVK
jgi:hypothetical protein